MIYDNSGHIMLTAWGDIIDEIVDGVVISFTSVVLKQYNGTTIDTTITALQ